MSQAVKSQLPIRCRTLLTIATKGAGWVKKKYFGTNQGDRWVFYSNYVDEDGLPSRSYIFKASKTPIKRHLKVKAEANPYDPNYRDYFIQRESRKWKNRVRITSGLNKGLSRVMGNYQARF